MDRAASILGLPKEVLVPVAADHQNICKFPHRNHDRYLKMQSILLTLLRQHSQENLKAKDSSAQGALRSIQKMLDIKSVSLEEHIRTSECRTLSSCRWILWNDSYNAWLNDKSFQTRILWVHGQPGSGKSVLASFLIDHLRETLQEKCQFFYFRKGEEEKENIASLLRSIAYQTACEVPEFRDGLKRMAEDEIDFSTATADVLWAKIFSDSLFWLPSQKPLYWIIDGLDESNAPSVLLTLLSSNRQSRIPLRIAVLSRPFLSNNFEELKPNIHVDEISLGPTSQDFRSFVHESVRQFQAEDNDFLSELLEFLEQGDGNFLWVRQKLANIKDQTTDSLLSDSIPPTDLEGLYHQMTRHLSVTWQGNDEILARTVLTWAAFSLRPISLGEIQEVYSLTPMSKRELKNVIPRVCGEFVEIDAKFRVNLVHETARQFLTEVSTHQLYLDPEDAQLAIFLKCMATLNTMQRQIPVERPATGSFALYSITSWHKHLGKMKNPTDKRVFQSLSNFFCGQSVTVWIHLLALHGRLDLLEDVSYRVTLYLDYLKKIRNEGATNSEKQERKKDLRQWTLDLENLVGHYGAILAQVPNAIYELIPPFCPKNSSIRKYAVRPKQTRLSIMGLVNNQWSNLGARFPVTRGENVREVICGGRFLVITSTAMDGRFYVFDIATNRKLQGVEHGDPILAVCLSHNGGSIAIYSPRQTKVWDICQARYTASSSNPLGWAVLDIGFTIDDKVLFVCLDNGVVRRMYLNQVPQYWEDVVGPLEYSSVTGISRIPHCASFSPGCNLLAVGYHGAPLSVWDMESAAEPISTLASISDVDMLTWNPVSKSLLGILHDGSIFKWSSSSGQLQILEDHSVGAVCSPDGHVFVTSHSDGSLKLRRFDDLSVLLVFSESSVCAGLTISRCGKKIYDIRDSFCLVWQAFSWSREAIFRSAEFLPQCSPESSVPTISKTMDGKKIVSAMSVCQVTGNVVVGYTSGELGILAENSKLLASTKPSGLSVVYATWSENAPYLATADVGAYVCVRRFNQALNQLETVFEHSASTKIIQLLFNKKGTLLLIAESHSLTILSADSGLIVSMRAISSIRHLWVNHPREDELLLLFDSRQMQAFLWENLRELGTRKIERQPSFHKTEEILAGAGEPEVKNVWTSQNMSLIVVQFACIERQGPEKTELIFIRTRDVAYNTMGDRLLGYLSPISEHVQFPLGIIEYGCNNHLTTRMRMISRERHDRLAFLDWNGWVCSVSLEGHSVISDFRMHFVIPRAWMNRETLAMSQVLTKGTYFCPINGEIAVLQGGF